MNIKIKCYLECFNNPNADTDEMIEVELPDDEDFDKDFPSDKQSELINKAVNERVSEHFTYSYSIR